MGKCSIENSRLKHAKNPTESQPGDGNASGFGAVTIDFNPSPDAHDRLRRLFTILVGLVEDDAVSRQAEPSPSNGDRIEP